MTQGEEKSESSISSCSGLLAISSRAYSSFLSPAPWNVSMHYICICDVSLVLQFPGDGRFEETPLVLAVSRGMRYIVELLLRSGVNINTLIRVRLCMCTDILIYYMTMKTFITVGDNASYWLCNY